MGVKGLHTFLRPHEGKLYGPARPLSSVLEGKILLVDFPGVFDIRLCLQSFDALFTVYVLLVRIYRFAIFSVGAQPTGLARGTRGHHRVLPAHRSAADIVLPPAGQRGYTTSLGE